MKKERHSALLRVLPFGATACFLAIISIAVLYRIAPIPIDDALRHIVMARHMLQMHSVAAGWDTFLYAGYFARESIDPWWLAHVSYIPFARLPDVWAIGLYTLVSIAILAAAMFVCIRRLPLHPSWQACILILLLAGDGVFLGRLLLGRPFVIATALTLLTYHATRHRRMFAAAICITIATLYSEMFVLPLGVGIAVCIYRIPQRGIRYALSGMAWLIGGGLVGMTLHPHGFAYARYVAHLFTTAPFRADLPIGIEMRSGFWAASTSYALLGLLLLVLFALVRIEGLTLRTLYRRDIALTACAAIGFQFLHMRINRAVDFAWPFVVLLLAETVAHTNASAWLLPPRTAKMDRRAVCAAFVALITLLPAHTLWETVRWKGIDTLLLRNALATVPPHANVLNVDWDTFPPLLLARPDLHAATGIDPTATYLDDPTAQKLLDVLSDPAIRDTPQLVNIDAWIYHTLLHFPFSDAMVVDPRRHGNLLPALDASPLLRRSSATGAALAVYDIVASPQIRSAQNGLDAVTAI